MCRNWEGFRGRRIRGSPPVILIINRLMLDVLLSCLAESESAWLHAIHK